MRIREPLFFNDRGIRLSMALEAHQAETLSKIQGIASLDAMTDAFLEQLVESSLVNPVGLKLDQVKHTPRIEQIPAEEFYDRFRFNVRSGSSYPKTVVRYTIPFTGEGDLFKYVPDGCPLNFPRGQIRGQGIEFDVVLWVEDEEHKQKFRKEQEANLSLIVECVNSTNSQVNGFNRRLPTVVSEAFNAKLDTLTGLHDFLNTLGSTVAKPDPITREAVPRAAPTTKKRSPREAQIIQHVQHIYIEQIEKMAVETFNQSNSNTGNVNNAIQSN